MPKNEEKNVALEGPVERIASVQLVQGANIFGVPLSSISETMAGITMVKCPEGIRVYREHQDGYETIYAAGIATARTRTEPRSNG